MYISIFGSLLSWSYDFFPYEFMFGIYCAISLSPVMGYV